MFASRLTFAVLAATVAVACAGTRSAEAWPGDRASAGSYSFDVVDAGGSPLRTFGHNGRTYVLGAEGQRYKIVVRNHSGRRVEAVVSVDGRDAIDGKPANWSKPGYIVPPYGAVTIDGFRVSLRDVAAFRFASVADSYAAQMGNDRNVGVVGVAVFTERHVPPPRPVMRREYDRGGHGDDREAKADSAPRSGPSAKAEAGKAAGAAPTGRSAAESSEPAPRDRTERPGLGTAFGERTHSPVVQVDFVRARPHSPDAVLGARYNDRSGLIALGIDVDGNRYRRYHYDAWQRETARPFANLPPSFSAPPPGWEE
ncbi:MAG: hypothetical protein FJ100_16055 [Deltaproteobacteria bacterium]|nr:hypothetical protein [Deltaproteobacteria bacterium]